MHSNTDFFFVISSRFLENPVFLVFMKYHYLPDFYPQSLKITIILGPLVRTPGSRPRDPIVSVGPLLWSPLLHSENPKNQLEITKKKDFISELPKSGKLLKYCIKM